MTPAELLAYMQGHTLAVECSNAEGRPPQAAVVGIVTTDSFEVFFDTVDSTRKWHNLRRDPRIALVMYDDYRTVQYEGTASEPTGHALRALKEQYFAMFPEGRAREQWPGIAYFLVRPNWIRYSDYSAPEPVILEFGADDLEG